MNLKPEFRKPRNEFEQNYSQKFKKRKILGGARESVSLTCGHVKDCLDNANNKNLCWRDVRMDDSGMEHQIRMAAFLCDNKIKRDKL